MSAGPVRAVIKVIESAARRGRARQRLPGSVARSHPAVERWTEDRDARARPATLWAVHLPDVLALARSLMTTHGVGDWDLGLDRARRRAGQTDHACRRITLSRHLMSLYDEAEVRETILHEIAHARVGASHGHDAVWRAEARRIGSTGRRLVDPQAPRVEGRWRGTCPAGHTVTRMRRPSVPLACATCSRSFRIENLLEWEHDGVAVTPEQIGPRYARALARLRSRGRR